MYVARMLRVLAPHIMDLDFTAEMEEKLDIIASGKKERKAVVEEFVNEVVYTSMAKAGIRFNEKGERETFSTPKLTAKEKAEIEKIGEDDKIPESCPNCGSDKYKLIPHGKF